MKVLFFTNIPSPYRVDFFNELGKGCDLTVCFERMRATDRDDKWIGEAAQNYREEYLNLKPYGASGSKGNGITKYIKKNKSDILIFSGYSSPSVITAMLYCQRNNIRYFIEYDGGFNKRDAIHKRLIKKRIISRAAGHFITCEELKRYLLVFGVLQENMHFYPFSSVREADVVREVPNANEKRRMKEKLGITEDKAVLAIGQFIHRKGFDVLLKAAFHMNKRFGIYIVGGEPTEQYLKMQCDMELSNVHFVGFKTKAELAEYYTAADVFAMPTRQDIWGLVVNEAMSYGLPVISSDACIAALEMVRDGHNGYIVPSENHVEFQSKIEALVNDEEKMVRFSKNSLYVAENYTIEKMAERHLEIFKELKRT